MARNAIGYLFAYMAFICFGGCEYSGEPSNRAFVDQQYLSSENYHLFSRQVEREQKQIRNKRSGLTARLKSFSGCSVSQTLSAPYTIDSLKVAEWSEPDTTACFREQSTGRSPYSLIVLAQTSFYDVKMVWILRSRVSMYRDQELLLATYRDETLLNAERIGIYRKNLKEHIATDIAVNPGNGKLIVTAVENRNLIYPIEQHNAVENVYYIDSEGGIEKKEV